MQKSLNNSFSEQERIDFVGAYVLRSMTSLIKIGRLKRLHTTVPVGLKVYTEEMVVTAMSGYSSENQMTLMHRGRILFKNPTEEQFEEHRRLWLRDEANEVGEIADSATIVFAHSLVEDRVLDSFKSLSVFSPQSLEPRIKDFKATFSEVKSTSLDELRSRGIARFMKTVRSRPLLGNVQDLFGICREHNKSQYDIIRKLHKIEIDYLKELDGVRHKLIHDPLTNSKVPEVQLALSYSSQVIIMTAHLVANCLFGSRIEELTASHAVGDF